MIYQIDRLNSVELSVWGFERKGKQIGDGLYGRGFLELTVSN
jgi:hypothetical protein